MPDENENVFTIEDFQAGIAEAVKSGMAEALLTQQQANDGGYYIGSNGETTSFKEFVVAVLEGDKKALKTLEVATGASGGYTVPVQWAARLLKTRAEKAIVRPRSTVFGIDTGASIEIPVLDQCCSPDGDESAFYSCLNFEWTEEGGTKTETEPTFNQLKLIPHELSGYVEVTDKLLKTSGLAFQSVIEKLFGDAIRHAEDYWFLRGDGVGKPIGVLNCDCLHECTRDTTDHIKAADIYCMAHHIIPGGNPVWVITHCAQEELWSLADALGNLLFMDKDLTKSPSGTLMGWPIIWTEKLPALGTAGDILLADFSYYAVGDLGGIEIQASPHYKFINNITTIRAVLYTDGKCMLDCEIELMNGENVSPFVALTT
jgi:HK97 family phage major capsid protein